METSINKDEERSKILQIRLNAFEKLSQFIKSDFDLEKSLNFTLDMIIELFNVKSGSLMLLDSSRKFLDFNVARGDKAEAIKAIKIKVGEGIAGKVAATGEMMMITNVEENPDFNIDIGKQIEYIPKDILCVPLSARDKIFGVIEIMDKENGEPFSEEEGRLLQSIGSTIAIMIENMKLYNIAADDVFRLTTLMKVSKIINTTMDIDKLLEYIMSSAKDVLRAEASSLMLIDEETNELFFNIAKGDKESEIKQIRVPVGQGIAGITAESGESLLINDAQNDPRVFKKADEETKFITRNMICVPMKAKDKIIGVLEVINSMDKTEFDDYDLKLFQSLADHAGIAINNRDLIVSLKETNIELAQRVKEVSSLYKVSHAIASYLDIDELFDTVVKVIANTLEISRCSILLYDKNIDKLKIKSAFGINPRVLNDIKLSPEKGIDGFVYSNEKPLLVTDIEKEQNLGKYKRLRYKTKSFIAVPISMRGNIIGVLNVSDKTDGSVFTENDLKTITMISGQIAESYENAILNQEVIEKQRIEKELEITYKMQQSVLPQNFNAIRGIDIDAISKPAKEVGGDFYDFIEKRPGKYGFIIADVSGKSIPASLFMAISRSTIKIAGQIKDDADEIMKVSNEYILADSKAGMFTTVFFTLIDTETKEIEFSSAGHNPQILLNSSTGEYKMLNVKGAPLGVTNIAEFEKQKIKYTDDDILVLFTDGVTEAINSNNEEYEVERLIESLRSSAKQSASKIIDNIIEDVNNFTEGQPQFDDFTLMVIKLGNTS